MSILIDLRSVIDEGVGASLTIKGETEKAFAQFKLGDIDYCCIAPVTYEIDFHNAGECVQAFGTVQADLSTGCVRCLCDFEFHVESKLEDTFFFEATDDEHGDPYPVIDRNEQVDIEPLLREALMVEIPFAPVHNEKCQGLCVKCGTDLNSEDCGCGDEPDLSHPFAGLKDLIN